jgi:hypothetical protein
MKQNGDSKAIEKQLEECKNLWRSNSKEMMDDEKLIHMTLEFFSEKFLRLAKEVEDPSMTKEQEARIGDEMDFINQRMESEIKRLKSI